MKKILLSATAVLAMSSLAMAGGDIAPVEEVVTDTTEVVMDTINTDSGFYLGGGYGYMTDTLDITDYAGNFPTNTLGAGATNTLWDQDYSSVMVQAGYKINQYVAVEARYWFGISDTYDFAYASADVAVDAFGIYVKPMYPVTDAFDIYALLGYGATEYTFDIIDSSGWKTDFATDSDDGFSWGIGAAYSFNENFSMFVDYVSIYSDDKDYVADGYDLNLDRTIDTVNLGVTYKF